MTFSNSVHSRLALAVMSLYSGKKHHSFFLRIDLLTFYITLQAKTRFVLGEEATVKSTLSLTAVGWLKFHFLCIIFAPFTSEMAPSTAPKGPGIFESQLYIRNYVSWVCKENDKNKRDSFCSSFKITYLRRLDFVYY